MGDRRRTAQFALISAPFGPVMVQQLTCHGSSRPGGDACPVVRASRTGDPFLTIERQASQRVQPGAFEAGNSGRQWTAEAPVGRGDGPQEDPTATASAIDGL